MEKIQTADCYTTIAMKGSPLYNEIQEMVAADQLRKHEGVIVLTELEFTKTIKLMKDAHDHGFAIGASNLAWDNDKSWTEFCKQNNLNLEYIKSLLQKL